MHSIKDCAPEYDVEVLGFLEGEDFCAFCVVELQKPRQGAPKGYMDWWVGDAVSGFDADLRRGEITYWAPLPPAPNAELRGAHK